MRSRDERRAGAGAAIAIAAVLATGCATAPRPLTSKYYFTVDFQNGSCPKEATASVKCPGAPGQSAPRRCLTVPTGKGQKVQFVSVNPDGKSYLLQFDPFGKTTISSDDDLPAVGPPKAYTFNVLDADKKCDPLDPQIILE